MKKTALSLALFFFTLAAGLAQNPPSGPQFFTVPDARFELVFEIRAFPNPATDRFHIETDFRQPIDFRLFSMAGQCAKSGRLVDAEIPVAELPNGFYGLELWAADGRFLASLRLEKR